MNLDTDLLRSRFRAEVESIEKQRTSLQDEINKLDLRLRGVETSLEALKAVEDTARMIHSGSRTKQSSTAPIQSEPGREEAASAADLFRGDTQPEAAAEHESMEDSGEGEEAENRTSFLDNSGLIPSFLKRHL